MKNRLQRSAKQENRTGTGRKATRAYRRGPRARVSRLFVEENANDRDSSRGVGAGRSGFVGPARRRSTRRPTRRQTRQPSGNPAGSRPRAPGPQALPNALGPAAQTVRRTAPAALLNESPCNEAPRSEARPDEAPGRPPAVSTVSGRPGLGPAPKQEGPQPTGRAVAPRV
jgi:hypothetical protein